MSASTLDQSKLYPDISDIMKKHSNKYNAIFNFETKLHTVAKDLDYSDSVLLTDIYIIRDYIENMTDYIEVKISIPLGTFLYDVYDNLDNIEVTLITTKQLTNNNQQFTVKERYKAAYILEKNTGIPNTISQTKADLNNQMPIVITLQLLDRSAETVRIKTTQGNFDMSVNKNKDMSIATFLKSVISEQTNKILIENKPSIDNFNIEETDNKDNLKSITIPSGTRIVELPDYIQNNNIGVYNGDTGIYIQKFGTDYFTYKKCLFIYSLYNNKKYDKAEYKIMFYSPLASSASVTDNTYKYKDKILRVLPHNITKINDNKETTVMSEGCGFKTSNSNSFMKKPIDMKASGPSFKKDSLTSEVIFKDRKDGLNFAPNKQISGNQFKLTAELLKKNGNYITIEVSNMDHDFIYPGAKCKMLYEGKGGKITEVFGVIHKALITYSNSNLNLAMNSNSRTISLTSHISLQVFCNSF
jgi:hypothetical protein